MDEARKLAEGGAAHGTAVAAGLQTRGRGRESRVWTSAAGKNLTFSLILRYGEGGVPRGLTLRAGLAAARVAAAIDPALEVAVKWPNDVMLGDGKCAGLLAESDGRTVLLGVGLNVRQAPGEMPRAVSIEGRLRELNSSSIPPLFADDARVIPLLLESVLLSLSETLAPAFDSAWHGELEKMLYMKGWLVRFAAGGALKPRIVRGTIAGIREDGALLVLPAGESAPQAFAAGEIRALLPMSN
jgi:BirA family biotin operon repressor/biotin-[acetyl-CoA-carboxylase] ligase